MVLYQKGNEDAFMLLSERLQRPLYFYIYRLVRNSEMTQDLIQDTLIKVVRNHQSYQPQSKLRPWIYTIARNLCIDFFRKKRLKEISLDQPFKNTNSFSLLDCLETQNHNGFDFIYQKEIRTQIQAALNAINADQRDVFLLKEIQGFKFHEIATLLNESENTIKSRMRYALKALRSYLEVHYTASYELNVDKVKIEEDTV
jgi:RNA polymerase sigma-70 factor (ECF subfamily)